MQIQRFHQLQIIWKDIPSPISVPKEARNRLADLLGDLVSDYWKNCKQIDDPQQREDAYDK
ncbi:MAG: hypothetical protein GY774_18010 [Planctomycetes bacterium]|nr:hypothetical protein [Planctomycetota bacterium]